MDVFGLTKPNEKRLREIKQSLNSLPPACRATVAPPPSAEFHEWQSDTIVYSVLDQKESLLGLLEKKTLDPPLRTDITNLKFSPDGRYVLAQDDSSVFVLSRTPLALLFRFDAKDAHSAQFTPDSKNIVFDTRSLRTESWNIADEKRVDVHEIVAQDGCIQTKLSSDGSTLACLNEKFDVSLIEVATNKAFFQKSGLFAPKTPVTWLYFFRFVSLSRDNPESKFDWVNMAFSPDNHYFLAANLDDSIAVDVGSHSQVSLHGGLPDMVKGGFAFMGPDRIIARDAASPKNSAVMEFPSGKALERLPIYQQALQAPTSGNFVILSPAGLASSGVFDLDSQKYVGGVNKPSPVDVYDNNMLVQQISGEIQLYNTSTKTFEASASIPHSPLGRLRAAAISSDLEWLALSGDTRGSVWNLQTGKRSSLLRGFRGAYFDATNELYADLPAQKDVKRTIAHGKATADDVAPGIPVDEDLAPVQYGEYLFLTKSANKQYFPRENVTIEVHDVADGRVLWARNFPHEMPAMFVNAATNTTALVWSTEEIGAKDEIKANADLRDRFAAMHDHKGVYLLELIETGTGRSVGHLLVDSGKGSFKIRDAMESGDWVLIRDTQNRALLYSLSAGEQKGTFFGAGAAFSTNAGLLTIENQAGQLDVYTLPGLEKRTQLVFPSPISLESYSTDGKKLFVLTANQTIYFFDTASLSKGDGYPAHSEQP